jgi:CubicO group peptidase (beta-lactamase class C family)
MFQPAFFAAIVAVPAIPADGFQGLEAALAEVLEDRGIPGGLVGIYADDEPPVELALGVADADSGEPMTLDRHVRIGSLSKLFVGQALLTLVDEGRVSIDDPVSEYVAGVPDGDRIILHHLGTHRSGLFNPIESRAVKSAFAAEPWRDWSAAELLGFVAREKSYFDPGAGHHYSNINTVLLAMVIEAVTGRPWEDEVRDRILLPLGLHHTGVASGTNLPEPFARGYALGGEETPFFVRGRVRHDVTETSPSWWGAAGNMYSTLRDLGKAARPLAAGALLGPEGRRILTDWTATDDPGLAYGFHVMKKGGMIGHDGDVPGYQAFLFYLPDQEASVVAVANLYGWSVRGMPGNALAEAAIAHAFPHRDRIARVESGLRPFAEAAGRPQRWPLTERMADHGIPGVSVAVIDGGRVAWAKAYGVKDTASGEPIDTDTRFQAGSISKVVAALTAMRLVDADALDLDRDVNALMTNWSLPRPDPWAGVAVTPRQLLSHSAGIGVHGFVGYPGRDTLPTNLQILEGRPPVNSPSVRVVAEPGTVVLYSGGGYQVLQQVLEDVSGRPFAELAQHEVFQPLGLTRTGYDLPPPDGGMNLAFAHDRGERLPVPFLCYPELAAAGLWSTPTEVATLGLAIRDSALGASRLLNEDSARAMLAPILLTDGTPSSHGLGPEVEGEGPTRRFGHSGGTVGYRSALVLYPGCGQGAVVMTNGAGDVLAGELLRAVADAYDWPGTDFVPVAREARAMTADVLAEFAGAYAIESNGTPMTVRVDGGGLRLEMPYKSPIRLLPAGDDQFFGTSHDREIAFERGRDERVVAATIVHGKEILFRVIRTPTPPQ